MTLTPRVAMSVNLIRTPCSTLQIAELVPSSGAVSQRAVPPEQETWPRTERAGFSISVDPQCQSPLAFALSVAQGLDARPRRLDASYLYDATGSALFERITEQPEYYLTRAEDRLLAQHSLAIRDVAGSTTLLELGSGASLKTRRLLDAWTQAGPVTYIPVDVDEKAIEQACSALRVR